MNNRITASPANGEMVSLLEGDIYTLVSDYTRGKTESFLLDVGIKEEEIEAIKAIMLEKI